MIFSSASSKLVSRRALSRAAAAATTTTTSATTRTTTAARQQVTSRRFVHVENRLKELAITLPKPMGPRANYDVTTYDEESRVMYVSGHLPFQEDGTLMTGKITAAGAGDEGETGGQGGKDIDYGYLAARHAALNIVATLRDRLNGDLDRIEKFQKVFGIVQSSDDFKHHHLVMDGASDVINKIFKDGKVGYHARSAIGTSTLPLDVTVEIEAIVKLKPELRFGLGQIVECKIGPNDDDWAKGEITQLRYKEPEWNHSAPYQIKLLGKGEEGGRFIFAPEDKDSIIRAV